MRIYVVEQDAPFHDWSKRAGALHWDVFHGLGDYPTLLQWIPKSAVNERGERYLIGFPPDWAWPGVTNQNREPLHIRRSGRFVPAVFSPSFTELIVSPRVREVLQKLPHVGFNEPVFEQLVDLPLPELGDFSWFERRDLRKYDGLTNKYLASLPHVAEFEKAVAGYTQLLPANSNDIASEYHDTRSVPVNFGSYHYLTSPREVPVSCEMLKDYPIVQTPHFLFREDAFAKIAPFLNLDFYAIAVLTIDD
jgi:hypothetical protein